MVTKVVFEFMEEYLDKEMSQCTDNWYISKEVVEK